MADFDLRWLTAICQGIMGITLMYITARIYLMPLHKRAETFGPVFTEMGVRWLMNSLPLFGFLGSFMIVGGVSRWAYFQRYTGQYSSEAANAVGSFEAVMAVFATFAFITAAWRFGRTNG